MLRNKLVHVLTPIFSLSGGFLTLFLWRRGVGFAPISLGIAMGAWILAGFHSRYFARCSTPSDPTSELSSPSRKVRMAGWLSQTVVVGLYQNVLFFVLPVWFGSAELLSLNIVFPVLLAALALFACFDDQFTAWVLLNSRRRTAASAVLLFSVTVPVVALQNLLPLRLGVGLSAAGATLAAVMFGYFHRRDQWKRMLLGALSAPLVGMVFYFMGYLLPPVPLQCVSKSASSGFVDRQPVDVDSAFPVDTKKVYVHFAVAAPARYQQSIRFQWYLNGVPSGRPLASEIIGGRKRGFRTRTFRSNPAAGIYRVDLETEGGQLIARVRFRIGKTLL